MHRMPIFHDDQSFRDQTERMFRDMQQKMNFHTTPDSAAFDSFINPSSWSSTTLAPSVAPRSTLAPALAPTLCPSGSQQFFELWPLGQQTQDKGAELLDDVTTRSLFLDLDPRNAGQCQGRVFRMSFDVRQYDPAEVSVRSEDKCLVVEAKHSEDKNGAKVARQFSRRIQLPSDVDPTRLSSTLSADGILTVQAPVPPCYQALTPATTQSQTTARLSPVPPLDPCSTGRHGLSADSQHLTTTTSRVSPVPFSSQLQPASAGYNPVTVLALNPLPTLTLDTPVITVDPATGRRRLELLLDLGKPFTASDVVVKVDGRRLVIEAKHELTSEGRMTTSSTQKQFDLNEQVDASTVQAMMGDDGKLTVTGFVQAQ